MRYLDNGGVSLALETRGSGRHRLLFVHGWISSRRIFYEVTARLDPARYTSHLLDLRGAGLSDRPTEGHDLDGYASDLRTALEAVGGPVDLIAHSMGGKVAQYVALTPPPNLRRLVLVAPGTARAYVSSARHRALAEGAFGSRIRIERFQRAAMVRDIAPDAMERLIDDALVAQRESWFGWYDRGRAVDFSDRVGQIAIPTIVIAGNRDPLAPLARLRRDVASAIPGAVFVSLRDVGHNIPVEAPTELAGIIERLEQDQRSGATPATAQNLSAAAGTKPAS
ncbi:MAG: alpha/beta hydrolase [Candidatus Eremiobacteraeota bacterium]|nr:alpha/beta hydrolase [Candidatus Eremiobacteraeota bacterium]